MKVTIGQYYKAFGSFYGLVAGLPFVPPFLHIFIPYSSAVAGYLYPPLGDAQNLLFAGTAIILLFTTYAVFVSCRSAQKIHPSVPTVLMGAAMLGFCALIALYVPYVRHIYVPSAGLEIPVSVGYQRSEFALRTYPQWSDWDMLHDRGPWEDQIQTLWTPRSIAVVRVLLWLCYTLTLICFLSVVSIGVFEHAAERTRGFSKGQTGGSGS